MIRGKETVVDNCRTLVLAIAYKSTIMVAFVTFKGTIELTVSYSYRGIIAQTGNEATIGKAGRIDGHRRTAVLNRDFAAIEHISNQSARILSRGRDGARHVQVAEGCIGYIVEGGSVLPSGRLVDSQRVAIAVKRTPVGFVFLPANGFVTNINVGKEAGVHVRIAPS